MKSFLKKNFSKIYVNSSRVYLNQEIQNFADSLKKNDLVLDAGAGDCKYSVHFKNQIYESADFCQVEKKYSKVTYECDLKNIPVEENRYDAILLSQVLEHIPDPLAVLKELNRVLKKNGVIWISAPLYYEEHEKPFDFYRYTQFAYQYLLKEAGFEIQKIDWLEGYFGTLSYNFKTTAKYTPIKPRDYGGGLLGIFGAGYGIVIKAISLLSSIIFGHFDLRHKYKDKGYNKNYFVIANKK